jgi:HSP20 family protein
MVVLNQLPAVFRDGSVDLQVDRLLDDAIQSVNEWSQPWDPTFNVFEDEQGFTVQMALPGLEANQIDVEVENDLLRIKGERKHDISDGKTWYVRNIAAGMFSCSFRLPDYVDHEKSTASYKQGLLTVTFSKREETKLRRIKIESQSVSGTSMKDEGKEVAIKKHMHSLVAASLVLAGFVALGMWAAWKVLFS